MLEWLSALPKEIYVFIISMVPVIEIRGALPYGILVANMDPLTAYIVAVAGNFLPVPFIIAFSRPVFAFFKKFRPFEKIIDWLTNRADKRAARIVNANPKNLMRYSAIALFVFVAIPLPGTGAWTGALIASVLNMRFKYALPCISAGIMTAGIIVALVVMSGVHVFGL